MAGPWEDFQTDTAVQDESPPWEDFKTDDSKPWDDFKRESLQSQTAAARAEGEQSLMDLRRANTAYAAVEPLTVSGMLNQPTRLIGMPDLVSADKSMLGIQDADVGPQTYSTPQFRVGPYGVENAPPRVYTDPGTGAAAGLGRIGAGLAKSLTTPDMLATAPLAGPSAIIRALFAFGMAKELPEQVKQAYEVVSDPDSTVADRVAAVGTPAVGAWFTKTILSHTAGPKVEIPDFIGRQLEMPKGAIPPRGEPVAPIERVTPEQAAAQSEQMSAPFEERPPSEPSVLAPEKSDVVQPSGEVSPELAAETAKEIAAAPPKFEETAPVGESQPNPPPVESGETAEAPPPTAPRASSSETTPAATESGIGQGPGARTGTTVEAPESYSGTALKNAVADLERIGWNMRDAPAHIAKNLSEAWIRAGRLLERDPKAGDTLVDELAANPEGRGLTFDESALLLRQKRILSDEMNRAAENTHNFDPNVKRKAQADYDFYHERMLTMLDAINRRGTAWGQEGRWRQVMAREDYSLATLVTQREKVLGKDIPPGSPEYEELKKHADRLEELNRKQTERVAVVEKEYQDQQIKLAMAEAARDAKTELPYHPKILELAEGYAKKWDERGKQALADLKGMFGGGDQPMFSGVPVTPAMLDKAIIYGTSKMVRGAVDLAKWTDAMVRDLGPGFAKYAADVFKASKAVFDKDVAGAFKGKGSVGRKVTSVLQKTDAGVESVLKKIVTKAGKTPEGRLPDIKYYLRQLGRRYAAEGVKEIDPFLDRMTADVNKVLPDLSRDDVRAIFGGYAGDVKILSKAATEIILRDMAGQSRELHKLSLLKQKILPPKLQDRAIPSQKERIIRKQVEAEKRTGGFPEPDPEIQLRSAMQTAETRLVNQIADLQKEIDTGEKIAKQKREKPNSERLQVLRDHRDALREIHDEVFKKPELTDAERLDIWKERTKDQINVLRDRRARGDFKPKAKPNPLRMDKEAIELQYLKEVEHKALLEMRIKDELSKRTTGKVILDSAANTARFAHMAMAGGEFSAVLKQGATGAFGRPMMTARAMGKMFQAFWDEKAQFDIKHEILTRDNAPLYKLSKLEFTDVGGRLSSMEEMYMFRTMEWMKKVPGLSHYVRYMDMFQRAFSTFLNVMRADTFDAMAREYGTDKPTAEAIANYVNVATGRGSHATSRFGGGGMNALFFAPRWSISRFQYLFLQPILAAGKGHRTMVAKQYARTLIGLSSVYALGYAAGGTVDWDPRSSKFGKIELGGRVIDPLFGLAPVMRIFSQVISGTRKNNRGQIRPVRENMRLPVQGSGKLAPFDPSASELMGRFAWSKLAPAPEAFVSAATGENVVGQKFNLGQKAIQAITPITYGDILSAIKQEGISPSTAIDLMSIFGLSSYIPTQKKTTNSQVTW